jgi:hypothetical protein
MKRLPFIILFAIFAFAVIVPLSLKSSGHEDDPSPTRVAARFNQHFRAADMPTTVTLYTPQETGLFRVNGYAVVTNYDPNGDFSGAFSFGWTDEASTKTQQLVIGNPLFPSKTFTLYNVQLGSSASTTFIVRAIESTPITVSIANLISNPSPPVGNNEFDVFFTIEKL